MKVEMLPSLVASIEHHHRLNVSLRIGLAIFGGYGLALLGASALATGMPFDFRPDAVSLAVMLAFLLYLVAVIWVFAAATLLRAALGLLIPAVIFGFWMYAGA
jgi:hypothetical protein